MVPETRPAPLPGAPGVGVDTGGTPVGGTTTEEKLVLTGGAGTLVGGTSGSAGLVGGTSGTAGLVGGTSGSAGLVGGTSGSAGLVGGTSGTVG
jgi:hypothetical protein